MCKLVCAPFASNSNKIYLSNLSNTGVKVLIKPRPLVTELYTNITILNIQQYHNPESHVGMETLGRFYSWGIVQALRQEWCKNQKCS